MYKHIFAQCFEIPPEKQWKKQVVLWKPCKYKNINFSHKKIKLFLKDFIENLMKMNKYFLISKYFENLTGFTVIKSFFW